MSVKDHATMKSILQVIPALQLFFFTSLYAQVIPSIEWQKSFGGTGTDPAYAVEQTSDHGFIVAGYSDSNDGDVSGNQGGTDYWIIKLDSAGNLEWQKTLGGTADDGLNNLSIQQTSDGGFITAGGSNSNDGDVSGNHGGSDYWIVKLNATGTLQWQKSLGGTGDEEAHAIRQTTDGGFVAAGLSDSNDGDISGNNGDADAWIVRLDTSGNLLWQKSLGGSDYDRAYSIQQIAGDRFIIAGSSYSTDGDVSGNHGDSDYWIVMLDSVGNIVWQKSLGGTSNEYATSIQSSSDGGFIVAGASLSNDNDVTENHGNADYWIVKLNEAGIIVWQKSLGGTGDDVASSIQQTTDSGYIVAGVTISDDGNVTTNHGYYDYWIVKLDMDGSLVWQKSLGGTDADLANSIQQTANGGFVVGGSSASDNGDVLENQGSLDYWIVKLTADSITGIALISNPLISLHPNPVQGHLNVGILPAMDETTVLVSDLHGRIIPLPTTFQNDEAELNTTSLANGFYTIRIINNKTGMSAGGKFIKAD